jgi:hypothetical protein
LAVDPAGNVLFADGATNRVYRVRNLQIAPVAGTSVPGFSGDGGPALIAQLHGPSGLTVFPDGRVLIADSTNNRIRILSPECELAANPATISFPAAGGPLAAAISSIAGSCTWTATPSVSWLRTSGSPATGVLQITADPNTNANPRSGAVSITPGGVSIAIDQAPGCSVSAAAAPSQLPFQGGPVTVSVTASPTCSWSALARAGGATIATGGGTGTGTFPISVPAYTGYADPRSIEIVAGDKTLVIPQAGSCSVGLTESEVLVSSARSYRRVNVQPPSAGACQWTVSTNENWVSPAQVFGAVDLFIQTNFGAARTALIRVGDKTLTLRQQAQGSVPQCAPGGTLAASSASVPAAGVRGTVAFNPVATNCRWQAASNVHWLQVYPLSGESTAVLEYTVMPNFAPRPRTGVITANGQTFTVTQAANTGTPDERFIDLMYFGFLGRYPSPQERSLQVQSLSSRAVTADAFFRSIEFAIAGRYVAGLYVGLLNRDPEYSGWLFQRNAMSHAGYSVLLLTLNFLESDEFALLWGTLDDTAFVRLLYRQVLLREPTQPEIDLQTAAIRSHGRTWVAQTFLNSPEFRSGRGPRLTAFLLYATLLQREPTPTERMAAMQRLAAGTPVATLIAEIVGSSEFNAQLN